MHLLVEETDQDRSIGGIQTFGASRDLLYSTNKPGMNNMILELVEMLRKHCKSALARMFGVTHARLKAMIKND